MYSSLFRIRTLVVLLLALLVVSITEASDSHGIMMVVKGDVKITSGGKVEAAKVGRKVLPGDTITAGPDSRAKIVMSDKNVLNISPDSKIVIEKYSNAGDKKDVELKVEYGKVRAAVEQKYDGDKSKFNIKTPSAVAGVRGTDFITGYSPSTQSTSVITFSGTVALGTAGAGGKIENPVYVQQGQSSSVAAGSAPEAPKAVPKEEINKMNSESSADTAGNNKGPGGNSENATAKNEEKKEVKEEPKQEAKQEAKNEPKQEPKQDAKKEDSTATAKKGPAPAAGDRAPASEGGALPGGLPPPPPPTDAGTSIIAGGPVAPIYIPPPPPSVSDFINTPTIDLNTKTRLLIQIQK